MSRLRRTLIKPEESRIFQRMREKDYTPVKWSDYFEKFEDVHLIDAKFRVYFSGSEGPMLVLLHGGGYSGLTWSLFTREIRNRIKCRVMAVDIRGHGETRTDNDSDLSIETLTKDIIRLVSQCCTEEEKLVFIGHSMGGAVAAHSIPLMYNAVGLCVIDVAEGIALESLSSMQCLLRNRPKSFKDIKAAVQWSYRTGQTQNLDSAKVSMPGQIMNFKTGVLASTEINNGTEENNALSTAHEDEDSRKRQPSEAGEETGNYSWRIDLSQTEGHWRGWFEGLSATFLNSSIPKVLIMANIHGLDTELTVGQMQGKFQMQVLPQCGHAIHEDMPHKVADVVAAFLIRHRIAEAIGEYSPVVPAC